MREVYRSEELQAGIPPAAGLFNIGWYAVQTGYRCEHRAARDLTLKGFETYLPVLREVHQWKDRRKVIDVPALSGYFFVHYDPTPRNRIRVLETNGVVRLLGGNNAPSQVSESELDALRCALESGVDCDRCDALLPGSMVKVIRGPLAGVQGRLVRIKNNLRLVIAISVVNQAVSAELGADDVEAIQV